MRTTTARHGTLSISVPALLGTLHENLSNGSVLVDPNPELTDMNVSTTASMENLITWNSSVADLRTEPKSTFLAEPVVINKALKATHAASASGEFSNKHFLNYVRTELYRGIQYRSKGVISKSLNTDLLSWLQGMNDDCAATLGEKDYRARLMRIAMLTGYTAQAVESRQKRIRLLAYIRKLLRNPNAYDDSETKLFIDAQHSESLTDFYKILYGAIAHARFFCILNQSYDKVLPAIEECLAVPEGGGFNDDLIYERAKTLGQHLKDCKAYSWLAFLKRAPFFDFIKKSCKEAKAYRKTSALIHA